MIPLGQAHFSRRLLIEYRTPNTLIVFLGKDMQGYPRSPVSSTTRVVRHRYHNNSNGRLCYVVQNSLLWKSSASKSHQKAKRLYQRRQVQRYSTVLDYYVLTAGKQGDFQSLYMTSPQMMLDLTLIMTFTTLFTPSTSRSMLTRALTL